MRNIAHENTQKAKEANKRLIDRRQTHSVSFNKGDIVEIRITKDNLLVWSDPCPIIFVNSETKTLVAKLLYKIYVRHFNQARKYTANRDIIN